MVFSCPSLRPNKLTYKDWMNTKSQRDWQVVEIYSDILSNDGTDVKALRARGDDHIVFVLELTIKQLLP